MDILIKEFDGIEYYLIDIYETEFSFGTVYHFVSKENGEKFCFYKNDNYIPIRNKIYLRKINEELEINTDILFIKKHIGNKKNKSSKVDKERWSSEKEYKAYDEVSNIIHELFPDIPYKEVMEILNDNSGIYSDYLEEGCAGQYHHKTKEIYLDKFQKNTYNKKRTVLHECIHKLTDRNGFLRKNNKYFVGLIEGATEKICEDKYGDKTSHMEYLDDKEIHINFSNDATYSLQQIIYRQMSQLIGSKKSDKSIINGEKSFFDEFSDLYGKGLLLYLSHRAQRLLEKSLSEKRKLKYLKEAQTMLLTKVFDKKLLNIQTEEDIINYMTELRNFEYVTARIEDDNTFQDYYNNKYDLIIELAKQKGIDCSKIEHFQYREVNFYPERNFERPRPFEITYEHINNLVYKKEIDLSKCTRMQVEPSTNFFNLDIILQNNIPISIVNDAVSFPINQIEPDDEYFDFIKKDFKIEDDEFDIYNIASNTYMIIKKDGSSSIYSKSPNEERIDCLSSSEVDLEITSKDIDDRKLDIEREYIERSYYNYEQISSIDLDETENEKGIRALFDNVKRFFKRLLKIEPPQLPEPSINQQIDEINVDHFDNYNTNRSSFVSQLNPDNPIYDKSTKVPAKQLKDYPEKLQETEGEIMN